MTSTLAPATSLEATDRCDRCGAQAYVRVVLAAGGDLFFCAHHWTRHADAIRPKARQVLDETHRLTAPAPDGS